METGGLTSSYLNVFVLLQQYLNEKRMETLQHLLPVPQLLCRGCNNTSMKRGWKRSRRLNPICRSLKNVATNTSMKRGWKHNTYRVRDNPQCIVHVSCNQYLNEKRMETPTLPFSATTKYLILLQPLPQ